MTATFHLLKKMIYFPLSVLKGIYDYWTYSDFICFFQGAKKQMEATSFFGRSTSFSFDTWVCVKIKQEGITAGFGPCVHLPIGFHFGIPVF